jgi:hypothetical protein
VNVWDALWPFFNTPVLKLPLLAVAVCGLGPAFDHVTVSPTWIVIVAGANLKSEIVSPGSPATCARSARARRRRRGRGWRGLGRLVIDSSVGCEMAAGAGVAVDRPAAGVVVTVAGVVAVGGAGD